MLTKPSLGQRLGLMGLAAALSLTFLTAPSAAEASQGENAAAPRPDRARLRQRLLPSHLLEHDQQEAQQPAPRANGPDVLPKLRDQLGQHLRHRRGNTYSAAIQNRAGAHGYADLRGVGSEHCLQVAARGNACVTVGYAINDATSGEIEGDGRYTYC